MKNIQTNENVKSNIIWGCLWDETLQWLVDSGDKTYEEIKKAVDWGNHRDSEFDYIAENGMAAYKNANLGRPVPTGSSEQNKANNIYDMSGNMYDRTLETYGSGGRSLRGAYCYYGDSADQRVNYNPANIAESNGVRVYFYIK